MTKTTGASQYAHIMLPDGTLHPIPLPPGRKQRKPEPFIMAFKDAMVALATRDDLRGADYKLALYLAGHVDYENWILVTGKQAAKDLKTAPSNISATMKRLQTAGVLEKIPHEPDRRGGWRFANTFLWRGKVKNLHEERARRLKAVTKTEPAPEGA